MKIGLGLLLGFYALPVFAREREPRSKISTDTCNAADLNLNALMSMYLPRTFLQKSSEPTSCPLVLLALGVKEMDVRILSRTKKAEPAGGLTRSVRRPPPEAAGILGNNELISGRWEGYAALSQSFPITLLDEIWPNAFYSKACDCTLRINLSHHRLNGLPLPLCIDIAHVVAKFARSDSGKSNRATLRSDVEREDYSLSKLPASDTAYQYLEPASVTNAMKNYYRMHENVAAKSIRVARQFLSRPELSENRAVDAETLAEMRTLFVDSGFWSLPEDPLYPGSDATGVFSCIEAFEKGRYHRVCPRGAASQVKALESILRTMERKL